MSKFDPNEIYVQAVIGSKFPEIAKSHMGPWYYGLQPRKRDFDLGQIVLYKQKYWMGALMWKRAKRQSYPRNRWLGWHACQELERISLVAELVAYQPRHRASDAEPDYSNLALNAAVSSLPLDWADYFECTPLLADTHLAAGSGFPMCFAEQGWTRTTDKNPRVSASHWITELVPDAKSIITAKHLDEEYTGGTAPCIKGLLPIPDELLLSFKEAFTAVDDPRANNSHFPKDGLLSVAVLAMICGATGISDIVRFSTRLSCSQAQLLALPFDKEGQIYKTLKYHTLYRLMYSIDPVQLLESLLGWLNVHLDRLPDVLHPGGDVIVDTFSSFMTRFRKPPSIRANGKDYKLPIGADPDYRECFKRDANEDLIE